MKSSLKNKQLISLHTSRNAKLSKHFIHFKTKGCYFLPYLWHYLKNKEASNLYGYETTSQTNHLQAEATIHNIIF